MRNAKFVEQLLSQWQLDYRALASDERDQFLQSWREIYSRKLFEKTGEWICRGFDWHVFSMELSTFVEKQDAIEMYSAIGRGTYILLSDIKSYGAYEITDQHLPTVEQLYGQSAEKGGMSEVYLIEKTLAWTFIITHEEDMGCGPYFSRSRWQKLLPPGRIDPRVVFGHGKQDYRRHRK